MLKYTLEVYSSSKTVFKFYCARTFHCGGNLPENNEYSFRVLAANSVGTVSSSTDNFVSSYII